MKQLDSNTRLVALCGILPKAGYQRFAMHNWPQFCGFINPLLAKLKKHKHGLLFPDTQGLETLMACTPEEARYMLAESFYAA